MLLSHRVSVKLNTRELEERSRVYPNSSQIAGHLSGFERLLGADMRIGSSSSLMWVVGRVVIFNADERKNEMQYEELESMLLNGPEDNWATSLTFDELCSVGGGYGGQGGSVSAGGAGATVGSVIGGTIGNSVGGPVGGMVGGVVGGIAGEAAGNNMAGAAANAGPNGVGTSDNGGPNTGANYGGGNNSGDGNYGGGNYGGSNGNGDGGSGGDGGDGG